MQRNRILQSQHNTKQINTKFKTDSVDSCQNQNVKLRQSPCGHPNAFFKCKYLRQIAISSLTIWRPNAYDSATCRNCCPGLIFTVASLDSYYTG